MKLYFSLWRLSNIKDLFFVPSQLQMNIFIPSFSVFSFSFLAVPLFFSVLPLFQALNLFAVAFCLLMLPISLFSETHLHLGLNKSSLLIKDLLPLWFFSKLNQYLDTVGGQEPTTGTNRQNYLYVLIWRRGQQRPDFFILWTNKPISLKARLTDRAAVDQKASLTFQSATAQIRQQQPFWDGRRLSDVLGGQ